MYSDKLRRFAWRALKFMIVGVGLSILSYLLLRRLVEHLNVSVYAATFIRVLVMTPIAFPLSRHFTWRDRKTGLWWQFRRYLPVRLVLAALHLAIFLPAVAAGVSYHLAFWVSVMVTGTLNFFASDKFIFALQRKMGLACGQEEFCPASA